MIGSWTQWIIFALIAIYTFYYIILQLIKEQGIESSEALVSAIIGFIYGGGLLLGGALRPSIVIGFLNLSDWNPALGFLILTVMLCKAAIFFLLVGSPQPEQQQEYIPLSGHEVEREDDLKDRRVIIGAILFGIGWGLSGLCPGTLLGGAFFVYSHAPLLVVGMILGAASFKLVKERWRLSNVRNKRPVFEAQPLLAQKNHEE